MTYDEYNSQDYWNKIWQEEGLTTWRLYPQAFAKISDIIGRGKKVLDIGCGVGMLAKQIRMQGCHVTGLDISPVAVDMAYKAGHIDVPIVHQLPTIPCADQEMDVVVATEVLEHFRDDDAKILVREAVRVGRQAIFVVPNESLADCPEHHQVFSTETLHALLSTYATHVHISQFVEEYVAPDNTLIRMKCLLALASNYIPYVPLAIDQSVVAKKNPKVLIAAPIYPQGDYSLDAWYWWCTQKCSYENIHIAVCVNNAESSAYATALTQKYPRMTVLDSQCRSDVTLERLTRARIMLQNWALDHGFDKILWLDLDCIPLMTNPIELLLQHDHPLVSGVYFYKNKPSMAVCYMWYNRAKWLHRAVMYSDIDEHLQTTPVKGFPISSCGFGVCLVDIQLARHVGLRYHYGRGFEQSEDIAFCRDVADVFGIEPILDCRVICKHVDKAWCERFAQGVELQ